MRGVAAVLVLLLAACSTAGGEDATTTTVPLAEPSTTTAPPTSTTPAPTTTTIDEECVDRSGDGVLRNRRGFICPPTMDIFGAEFIQDASVASQYLPGTYVTRHFIPALSFTRSERFRSIGEDPGVAVSFDSQPAGSDQPQRIRFTDIFSADLARGLRDVDWGDVSWVEALESGASEVAGHSATRVEFTISGQGCGSNTAPLCTVELDSGESVTWNSSQRIRLLFFDVGGQSVAFHVQAHPDLFDDYWTEVAEPILDSVEFLDP